MFTIHENGTIGLDMNKVEYIHKYGIVFKDGKELVLPQTVIKKVIKRFIRI